MASRGVRAAAVGAAAAIALVSGVLFAWHPWDVGRGAFPAVDTAGMSFTQLHLLDVLRAEYAGNAPGTKYSEGVAEPWCADFVSWVLNRAGAPLANPNSGSWRIPGVATLQAYYQSVGRFAGPGGYAPRFGDVVIYATGDRYFGQHTQIVLAAAHGDLTTIGGNQRGGITIRHTPVDDAGIAGFGRN